MSFCGKYYAGKGKLGGLYLQYLDVKKKIACPLQDFMETDKIWKCAWGVAEVDYKLCQGKTDENKISSWKCQKHSISCVSVSSMYVCNLCK